MFGIHCNGHDIESQCGIPIQTRSSIPWKRFRRIHSDQAWGDLLRSREIRGILGNFPKNFFDNGLELGCGSGHHSRQLTYYCKHLTATEYDAAKITACETEKISFAAADAQNLSEYASGSMDLIYSSNMIEHLPRVDNCLRECSRILKEGGIIVHTVPNRTWKLFHLLMFFPVLMRGLLFRLPCLRQRRKKNVIAARDTLDNNLRSSQPKSLLSRCWPEVHGISKTHWQEFAAWGEKKWLAIFDRNELDVLQIVRLPFYYGHGYKFGFVLRVGNVLRISSSTAYILRPKNKRKGGHP
jgi:SAM-dependent methyltransferase